MRILLLHHRYRSYGGEDQVVDSTFTAFEAMGHNIKIFETHSPKTKREQIPLLRKTLLPSSISTSKLENLIKEFKPDVVHAHNLFPYWFMALPDVALRTNIRVVLTLHNFRFLCLNGIFFREHENGNFADCTDCLKAGNFKPGLKNNCRQSWPETVVYYSALRRYSYGKYLNQSWLKAIVCPSEFLRKIYADAGVSEGKLKVLHNPADLSWLEKLQAEETKKETPAQASPQHVLYLGRLSHEKGVNTIPEMAYHLPDTHFHIVGDGPLHENIESLRPRNVTLYGHLRKSDETLQTLWQQSGLVLIPSTCFENYPLFPLEAKTGGKWIIAADRPGIKGAVGEYPHVHYFKPGQAREAVSAIQSVQQNYSAAQPESVSVLTAKDHAEKLLELYNAL